VVVHVLADVVEVVVFPAGADALLRVARALELSERLQRGVRSAEEQGLVLVHAGVGKEEGGVVVGHAGGGGPVGVVVLVDEEVDEVLADLLHGPGWVVCVKFVV